MEPLDLAKLIVDIVEERKADDIVLLDLRPNTILADYFVICTGNSDRQIRALMDYVREGIKEKTRKIPKGIEGTPESGWVLMDYGDVIVHLFAEDQRDYYDIESLWSSVSQVVVSIQ